jgi:hypothetical protein
VHPEVGSPKQHLSKFDFLEEWLTAVVRESC